MLGFVKRFLKKYFVVTKVEKVEVPVFQDKLLENKVALIIGGSGGIGSAIADAYVKSGCKVVITGTKEEKMKKICSKIGTNDVKYLVSDLKNVNDIKNSIAKTIELFGKVDILVYSAGIHCHDEFMHVAENTWDSVMNINLKGMYFACQEVADYMIKNKIKGHILTIGSASGSKPGWTPYEISKSGVKSLTLGMADKLIKHGIVVNGIAPGPVATEMLGKHDSDDLTWQGNPTGRMCAPCEIANLAVYLVSSMGDMVVGDTFYVSGGSGTVCIDK